MMNQRMKKAMLAGEEANDDDPPSNEVAVVAQAKPSTGKHSYETTADKNSEAKDPILDFEPDYTKIDAISFFVLCNRLEKMLQQRNRKTNRQSKDQVFTLLIDDSLRTYLKDSSWFYARCGYLATSYGYEGTQYRHGVGSSL
jgi:hypothetical protein